MMQNLMTSLVNVNRPTPGKGTSGGQTNTYASAYTNLGCSIQPISTNWLIQYQQRHIDVSHSVYFNTQPTILIGDQLVFGSRTFLVRGIRDFVSLGRVLVVDCLEVT